MNMWKASIAVFACLISGCGHLSEALSPSTYTPSENDDHPPTWGQLKPNGTYTQHRGVMVEDFTPVPRNSELDRFRDDYWKRHRVVKFTLVEGEQDAPFGENGKLIRVRATAGIPAEVHDRSGALLSTWPSISICAVNKEDGRWCSSPSPASLPTTFSVVVELPRKEQP